MLQRLEQERAQARAAPLAAALAEAQQVMCTASTDYIHPIHTYTQSYALAEQGLRYIGKERDHSFAAADIRYIGLHLSIVVGIVNALVRALTGPGAGRAAGQRLPRAACALPRPGLWAAAR